MRRADRREAAGVLDPQHSAADDPGSTWVRKHRPKLEYQVGLAECAKRLNPATHQGAVIELKAIVFGYKIKNKIPI